MRYAGLRQTDAVLNTAQYIEKAVKGLVEFKNGNKAVKVVGHDVPVDEKTADEALVDKAYDTLTQIFSKHFEGAMLEAGQFIIKEFYNGDLKLARRKKATKDKSLNKLIERLQNQAANAPSKSWIYNAVNLVVDCKDFGGFHTYGKLLLSHKVLLFSIDDRKIKEQLIKKTVAKKFTVDQLKQQIAQLKDKRRPKGKRPKSLPRVIKKPELLFSDDFSSAIEAKSLTKLRLPTLKKIHVEAEEKIVEIERNIAELNSAVETQQQCLNQYREFITLLQTIEGQKSEKEPKKEKGTLVVLKSGKAAESKAQDRRAVVLMHGKR